MARKGTTTTRRSAGQKTNKKSGSSAAAAGNLILVDPRRIRFQHSRIRPQFSGCGRSVHATLESIRAGELAPSDLPPIQASESIHTSVVVGGYACYAPCVYRV